MEELFVSCPHHFEDLLYSELKTLHIPGLRKAFCGIFAPKSIENVYRINYESRLATRVLWPLLHFACPDKEALYLMSKKLPWQRYLKLGDTFAIDANVNHPKLTNSLYAALVVKDAICDVFRDATGQRPSVDIQNPDVQLNLFIQKGFATIYLDTSRIALHKRGWRKETTAATLHESIAAGLLLLCGYNRNIAFCDPFAGSGTFLIESAMMATNTPAGFFRSGFGFESMPQFDSTAWQEVKKRAESKILPLQAGMISGCDKDLETFKTAYRNIKGTPFRGLIQLENQDVRSFSPPKPPQMILCNPPYGRRLELTRSVFEGLNLFLSQKCQSSTKLFFIGSESESGSFPGKTAHKVLGFKNGGLNVALWSV